MNELDPSTMVAWYAVFVFSATIHEAAHAWYAYRNGDPTAYYEGQVSLNPLPHIQREPFGMVVMPLVSMIFMPMHFPLGFASAPYNPSWAARYPKKAAWMSLAGPLSNLLVAFVAIVLIKVALSQSFILPEFGRTLTTIVSGDGTQLSDNFATLISMLFSLNLLLFVFNLIPLPPLDGYSALPLVLNRSQYAKIDSFFVNPMMRIFGLIIAWNIFPFIFSPVINFVIGTFIY